MAILSFQLDSIGQAGQKPKFIYINTNDTIDAVITPGYLNSLFAQGNPITEIDMALVATSITPYARSVQVGLYDVDFVDGNWSLVPYGSIDPLLDGQIVIGATGLAPMANTLTAGPGIAITNGPNSITISTGGFLPWLNVTTPTQLMAANTAYVCNCVSSSITFSLPVSASIGQEFQIVGNSSMGWSIAQNASQTIHFGNVNSTTGATGSVASSLRYDGIIFVCTVVNTDFVVYDAVGNLTVA